MVSSVAHRPPAANIPPMRKAACQDSGSSSARMITTERRLPTAAAATPQTLAKLAARIPMLASGSATASPAPRTTPNTLHVSAPIKVKASSVGTRRRMGPPVSQRHVMKAASAA